MKTRMMFVMLTALLVGGIPLPSYAQRGMGETTGVGRSAVKPDVVTLSGRVREVVTEGCGRTTGRAPLGTHVLLTTEEEREINVHLGPAAQVAFVAERLSVGTPIVVTGFQTDKLPADHYVAQQVTIDQETLQLRDAELRPVWAGRGIDRDGAARSGLERDSGPGPGAGRGAALGRGKGYGRGMRAGWNRGGGMGAGWNRGAGMGAGWNRGGGMGQGRAYIEEKTNN
ncbi:MAG: hypothetical protein ACYC4U_30030 [Pirellulaceae bacterium]